MKVCGLTIRTLYDIYEPNLLLVTFLHLVETNKEKGTRQGKGDALISSGEADSGNLKNKCVPFSLPAPFHGTFQSPVKWFDGVGDRFAQRQATEFRPII